MRQFPDNRQAAPSDRPAVAEDPGGGSEDPSGDGPSADGEDEAHRAACQRHAVEPTERLGRTADYH